MRTSSTGIPRTVRLSVATAAVVALVALLGATHGNAAPAKPVVGQVVVVGGTKNVTTRDPATGALRRVAVNERLRLGQQLVLGRGVSATLRVRRPAGVSPDIDLITLRSLRRTNHRVQATRSGVDTIVRIRPG